VYVLVRRLRRPALALAAVKVLVDPPEEDRNERGDPPSLLHVVAHAVHEERRKPQQAHSEPSAECVPARSCDGDGKAGAEDEHEDPGADAVEHLRLWDDDLRVWRDRSRAKLEEQPEHERLRDRYDQQRATNRLLKVFDDGHFSPPLSDFDVRKQI
jgi:hypothetical protein